jgi:Tfp pilus assembly ATPase PilU
MVTMDQALVELVKAGRITRQTALAAAVNREAVERGATDGRPVQRPPVR